MKNCPRGIRKADICVRISSTEGNMGIFNRLGTSAHPRTAAIILAAGSGRRFSNIDGEKQNRELCGIPVIVRTLSAFERCPLVDEIVLVCRKEDVPAYSGFSERYGFCKPVTVTEGGAERMESALAGIEAVSDKAEFVAVHDGARCLITPTQLEKVLRAAYDGGAAAAGYPSVDTVKYSEDGMYIGETPDRSKIWLIGTPQVFKANMYRAAIYMAKKDGVSVTDDCMMAERLGFKIRLVDIGRENIKITSPEDIRIAEGILGGREDGEA